MPVVILWLIGSGIAAAGAGYLAKGTGEAVQETANSTVKLAVVGAVLFIVAKKYKVI